jgi:hypothetical protein
MQKPLQEAFTKSTSASLARSFARLGHIGLWMQLALGTIPVAILVYTRVLSPAGGGTRSNLPLIDFLTCSAQPSMRALAPDMFTASSCPRWQPASSCRSSRPS